MNLRKVLSFIIVLCMCLPFIPTAAFATGETVIENYDRDEFTGNDSTYPEGVSVDNYCDVTLSGGTWGDIYVRSGYSLTIEGTSASPVVINGKIYFSGNKLTINGNVTVSQGIEIRDYSSWSDCRVSIYGGTFGDPSDSSISSVICSGEEWYYSYQRKIQISGGVFYGDIVKEENSHFTIKVLGGTFGTDIENNNDVEFLSVVTFVDNGDGTYTVPLLPDIYQDSNDPDVYHIITTDGFADFRDSVNAGNTYEGKTVLLNDDIELPEDVEWVPIGVKDDSVKVFKGTFDGQDYCISGINITESDPQSYIKRYQALFGYTQGATIRNLTLGGGGRAYVQAREAAGLVAYMDGGLIENISSYAGVSGSEIAGGIVAETAGNCTIRNCTSSNVQTVLRYSNGIYMGGIAGGIVGLATGATKVLDCQGYSIKNGVYLGGIVGSFMNAETGAEISRCSGYDVSCYISGAGLDDAVGGILGYCGPANNGTTLVVSNNKTESYSGIVGYTHAGGIVGVADAPVSITDNINYCNVRCISDGETYPAGIVSYAGAGCYVSGNVNNYVITDNQQRTFVGEADPGATIEGDNVVYLTIETVQEFKDFADAVNAGETFEIRDVYLEADIDLSELNGQWTPIGEAGNPDKVFKGVFYGQGHTVSGLSINDPSARYQALFGYAQGARIEYLTVDGSVSAAEAAGVVAQMDGGYIGNVTNNVTVTAASVAGGIICLSAGEFTMWYGSNYGSVTVSGSGGAGGIIGAANDSTRANYSDNYGDVTGANNVGGGIGYFEISDGDGYVWGIHNYGNVTATSEEPGTCAGGILGAYSDASVNATITFRDCYNYSAVSGYDYAGGIVGIAGAPAEITDNGNYGTITCNASAESGVESFPSGIVAKVGVGTKVTNNWNEGELISAQDGNTYQIIGDDGGCFSENNIYYININSLEDLENFRDSVNAGNSYYGVGVNLNTNITLTEPWIPIGYSELTDFGSDPTADLSATPYFAGMFYGNGYTISGLSNYSDSAAYDPDNVNWDNEYVYGLFGVVGNGASISYLSLDGVDIDTTKTQGKTGNSVGALVGYAFGDFSISGINVSGSVTANDAVGAIVGRCEQGNFTDGVSRGVSISSCTSDATVTGGANAVGTTKAAGLVGYISDNNKGNYGLTFTYNTFTGTVSGAAYNGLFATFDGTMFEPSGDDAVLVSTGDHAGNSYFGYENKYKDFNSLFKFSDDNAVVIMDAVIQHFMYYGYDWMTWSNVYYVYDAQGLAEFRDSVNDGNTYAGYTIKLRDNIDLSELNGAWTPIGTHGYREKDAEGNPCTYFAGIFDGDGYTISGLTDEGYVPAYTDSSGRYAYGLFGSTCGATVRNVTLTDVSINAAKGDSVGALVGFSGGGLTVSNCSVSGSVAGLDAVGGIIGRAYNTIDGDLTTIQVNDNINNAAVSVTTTGSGKVAGVIGYVTYFSSCSIYNNVNNGNVTMNATGSGNCFEAGVALFGGDFNANSTGIYDDEEWGYNINISGNTNNGTITAPVGFAGTGGSRLGFGGGISQVAGCAGSTVYGCVTVYDNYANGSIVSTVTPGWLFDETPIVNLGQQSAELRGGLWHLWLEANDYYDYEGVYGRPAKFYRDYPSTYDGCSVQYDFLYQLATANDGDTVTLHGDITVDSKINITKNVTIDLGGHTVTATGWYAFDLAGGTLKNGTVDLDGQSWGIQVRGETTFENVEIVNVVNNEHGQIAIYAWAPATGENYDVTIENSLDKNIEGRFYVDKKESGKDGDVNFVVKGGTFNVDPTAYVPAGYAVRNYNGTWTVGEPVTVTFNLNGGSYESSTANVERTIMKGEAITELVPEPTNGEYTLEGWYSDTQFKMAFDFNSAVTGDITLYACWIDSSVITCTTSLSLRDSIDVNIYISNIPGNTSASGYYVMYSKDNVNWERGEFTDANRVKAGKYVFSIPFAANQVTGKVYLRVYDDTDQVVKEIMGGSGYSIKDYCDYIVDNSSDAKLRNLCKALISYGYYAQVKFPATASGWTDDVRYTDTINATISSFDGTDDLNSNYSANTTYADPVTGAKASLELKSRTELNFYLYGVEDAAVTVTVNGEAYSAANVIVEPASRDNETRCRVKIKGLNTVDLTMKIVLTSGGTEIEYSPMTYIRSALNGSDEANRNVCKALYNFVMAAKTYFVC